MRHIVSLAFAKEGKNFDEVIVFGGEEIRLTSISTNFDVAYTCEILKKYDGVADVFCITGIPPRMKYKGGVFYHPEVIKMKSVCKITPILDGQGLKNVFIPYAIRKFYLTHNEKLVNKKIAFYAGATHKVLLEVMEELSNKIVLSDPYYFFKMPFLLHSNKSLEKFIKFLEPLATRMPLKKTWLAHYDISSKEIPRTIREFYKSDIFVGNETTFSLINLDHLKDKVVVIDFLDEGLEERLRDVGVKEIIVCLPNILKDQNITLNYSVMEALLQLKKGNSTPLTEEDYIDAVVTYNLNVETRELSTSTIDDKIEKFAFIIHPLSKKYLFKHPLLRPFKKYSAPVEGIVEEVISHFPGAFWGKMKGITSEATGKEVEGLIYMVTDTPKKLLEKEPEVVYKKLARLAYKAHDEGAKIIGLGAYTKIVGDAGVSVANMSPIPVTTGNSLSACSTLWAATFAIDKMGLVEKKDGIYQGKAMIIGATGSIGAVSAKILASKWKEVVIVAPRGYKLLELKEDIQKIAPQTTIHISIKPEGHTPSTDLIITTTSAQGGKILDIEKVKPGAVICDVSRPFDISEEDALKRPDVMVVASGEVILPGNVEFKFDLGLEGNVVYACLAETALLAMAGKYECFTLSRNIDYAKVLEIDHLSSIHGVRLSEIMGHQGIVTDEEFKLCREHALEKLKEWNSVGEKEEEEV